MLLPVRETISDRGSMPRISTRMQGNFLRCRVSVKKVADWLLHSGGDELVSTGSYRLIRGIRQATTVTFGPIYVAIQQVTAQTINAKNNVLVMPNRQAPRSAMTGQLAVAA